MEEQPLLEDEAHDSGRVFSDDLVSIREIRARKIYFIVGILLFALSAYLIIFDILTGKINSRLDSFIGLGLLFVMLFILIFSVFFILNAIIKEINELNKYVDSLWGNVSNGFVNFLFFILFVVSIVYTLILLINPEGVLSMLIEGKKDQDLVQAKAILFNAQVLTSVCLGGFLGGFVRETYFRFLTAKEEMTGIFIKKFWIIIFSLLGSVLISLIFFLLLRAGILKSDSVDSYNLYGVVGVSIISGYFSDKVLKKVAKLFKDILDNGAEEESDSAKNE